MSDIIQNTINAVLGDGARPAKFKCQIMPPHELMEKHKLTLKDLDVFCNTSKIPGLNNQNVEYKWKGRGIQLRGIQEYDQKISCTFYVDEKHRIRQLFIDWILHSQNQNFYDIDRLVSKEDIIPNSIHLYQLDYELYKETALYSLFYCFPTSISEIELNYETLNAVETFTVEFTFTFFEVSSIENNGYSANDIANKIQSTIQNIANKVVNKAKELFKEKVLDPIANSVKEKAKDIFKSKPEKVDDFITC